MEMTDVGHLQGAVSDVTEGADVLASNAVRLDQQYIFLCKRILLDLFIAFIPSQ
jgi:hypothetical protein